MIINSQRTIYGLEFQSDGLINTPYTPRANTTLNEKHGILTNEPLGADTAYGIKYLAIGVGGNPAITGNKSFTYSEHSPTDAGLFDQIPYVMRPKANPLPAAEAAKYRHVTTRVVKNTEYLHYYLKAIPSTDITKGTYIATSTPSGTTALRRYTTNTGTYLKPTPRNTGYSAAGSNEFINSTIKIKFSLTPAELSEINNVLDILYGVGHTKTLNEIGICSGLEKTVNGVAEALRVQIFFHAAVNIDTKLTYDPAIGYLRAIELGGSDPLYV